MIFSEAFVVELVEAHVVKQWEGRMLGVWPREGHAGTRFFM